MLTIIFIHIVISKQIYVAPVQSSMLQLANASNMLDYERRGNPLLTKMLKLDAFNIIMSLIKIDNLHLREHSIKILQLLIFVSEEFRRKFKEN